MSDNFYRSIPAIISKNINYKTLSMVFYSPYIDKIHLKKRKTTFLNPQHSVKKQVGQKTLNGDKKQQIILTQ
jgi:hypothetical protein